MSSTYWYQNPAVLLRPPYRIFPSPEMTLAQRSNAFALLILVVSLVLFMIGYKGWWMFLLFGLAVVLVVAIVEQARAPVVEYYQCPIEPVRPRYRGYRRD